MKKTKEFNNILDDCLERLLVKSETIEQCLQSYPEHAAEIEPLLRTAMATKKALAIQPHPEFKAKARYQFHSALQEMERKRSRPFFGWHWQPQWVTAMAIVLALLLAGSGTVAAASGSMPDSPLYPVKLATEQAQLVLTPSALGKAELYAKLADRRVIEIVRMAGENKPEQIERTAQRLDAYLTKIADLASAQEVTSGVAIAPAAEEAPVLVLPEQAKEDKEARIRVDRRAKLKAAVVRLAINHPERLRAMLEKAPESAKPALRRVIAVSTARYKKALDALD